MGYDYFRAFCVSCEKSFKIHKPVSLELRQEDELPAGLTPTEAIERGVGEECPNCSKAGTLKPALDPYAYRYNDDRERREFGGLTTEQYRKCYPYA